MSRVTCTTNRPAAVLCAASLWLPLAAPAGVIDASLVPLGGADYRFDYRLTNTGVLGPGTVIASFDIAFLASLITAWTEIGGAADAWTEFSAPVLGDDLFIADVNQGTAIPIGGAQAFSVTFTWSGSGLPGTQVFNLYDPLTFDVLFTGETSLTGAPIPGVAVLMLPPLGWLLGRRRIRPGRPVR